jgi:hypothetical protein
LSAARIQIAKNSIEVFDYPDEADRKWRMSSINKLIGRWWVPNKFALKFYTFWGNGAIFASDGNWRNVFTCATSIPSENAGPLTAPKSQQEAWKSRR